MDNWDAAMTLAAAMLGMPSKPSPGAASPAAVAVAAPIVDAISDGRIRSDEQAAAEAREVLDAVHDPALGLDRSVCLRDVVAGLRDRDAEWAIREFVGEDAVR